MAKFIEIPNEKNEKALLNVDYSFKGHKRAYRNQNGGKRF